MNTFYQYYNNFLLKLSKEDFLSKIIFFLICLLPIGLIAGTLVSESIIIFLSIIYIIKFNKKIIKDDSKPILYVLLLVSFYLIINLIFSINYNNSLLRNLFFFKYVIFVLGTIFFLTNNQYRIKFIFNFWIIILFIFCIDLFYQFIFMENIFGYVTRIPEHRTSGLMFDELKAGSLLIGLSLIPIIFNIKHSNEKMKYLFIILLFYFSLAIYSTGERANFLKCLTVIFPLIFFVRKKNFLKAITVSGIFIIILLSIFFGKDTFKGRYYEHIFLPLKNNNYNVFKFINESNYGQPRGDALKLFNERKFFGLGNKNFRITCEKDKYQFLNDPKFDDVKCNTHPHQFYYELLSEHGILGILVFLIIIFLFIKQFYNFFIIKKDFVILTSFILIISFFYPLIPSGSFFTSFNASIFWLNVSIYYSLMFNSRKKKL